MSTGAPGRWPIRPRPAGRPGRGGVALLEVVLALALFFGVSVAILGSLSACVRSARDIRTEAQAADLAVTLFSEIQLGLVPLEDTGPVSYEDEALADWTWQVTVTPLTSTLTDVDVSRVEIVIRNTPAHYVRRVSHLLAESVQGSTLTVVGETP